NGFENCLREPHLLWEQPGLEVVKEVIKESGALRVARLPLSSNGHPEGIFIKRSSTSGPWETLKRHLHGSRAFCSWKASHALLGRGLQTPLPLGAASRKVGKLAREDFFVTEEVPNALGIDWFVLRELGPQSPVEGRRERKRAFLQQFSRMVRRLHALGIYHPDLKGSNILVSIRSHQEGNPEYEFFLVDLERMRVKRRLRRHERIRNLSQINASLNNTASISRIDRLRFLKAYLGSQGLSKDHRLLAASRPLWGQILRESQKRLERGGRSFI
ncbi:MAG: lipopolysaccharide kinase InaA family protein, partial [Candidatus Binatia bacterium]